MTAETNDSQLLHLTLRVALRPNALAIFLAIMANTIICFLQAGLVALASELVILRRQRQAWRRGGARVQN